MPIPSEINQSIPIEARRLHSLTFWVKLILAKSIHLRPIPGPSLDHITTSNINILWASRATATPPWLGNIHTNRTAEENVYFLLYHSGAGIVVGNFLYFFFWKNTNISKMSSSIAVTQLFQQLKHACSDIEEDAKSLKRNITSNTTSHPTHDAQGSANSILTYSTHLITNLLTTYLLTYLLLQWGASGWFITR